jgi:Holliday junction resolvase RusA-like endonuclease
MIIKFSLPVRGFSVNSTYYASKKIKTKEFREWEAEVTALLEKEKQLGAMGLLWRQLGGFFSVNYLFFYPEEVYWNEFGQVSARTFDLTNVEKTLQDLIFKQLGVDDRHVTVLRSYKRPAEDYRVEVILKLNAHAESDRTTTVRTKRNKRGA